MSADEFNVLYYKTIQVSVEDKPTSGLHFMHTYCSFIVFWLNSDITKKLKSGKNVSEGGES